MDNFIVLLESITEPEGYCWKNFWKITEILSTKYGEFCRMNSGLSSFFLRLNNFLSRFAFLPFLVSFNVILPRLWRFMKYRTRLTWNRRTKQKWTGSAFPTTYFLPSDHLAFTVQIKTFSRNVALQSCVLYDCFTRFLM